MKNIKQPFRPIVKEFKKVESNDVCIHLPDDFLHKNIEITVRVVKRKVKTKRKKMAPLFTALSLDTRGFKFDREEANER